MFTSLVLVFAGDTLFTHRLAGLGLVFPFSAKLTDVPGDIIILSCDAVGTLCFRGDVLLACVTDCTRRLTLVILEFSRAAFITRVLTRDILELPG
tara:strand:- start:184 stop:468 length:285 start_codon:yes stop_codon:yes gene_type:complete